MCRPESLSRLLLAAATWAAIAPAHADVKPAPVCGDGMVLQQGVDGRLWGTAEPGEVVTVTFRGREARATTGTDGDWRVAVATGTAGGPFELSIAGRNTITYTNVLVGEVWLCSGQSNMDWGLNSCDEADKAFAATGAANPRLRLFTTFEHGDAGATAHGPAGVWVEAKPETITRFSAVALFFGRHLQERLNVPVGLIHASNGGMPIEAFMSPKVVAPFRRLNPDGTPSPVNSMQYPRLIEPLLDCRLRGVIWYQGEGNGGEWSYSRKLPALIEDWRAGFANPDLAFHVVQLPPFSDSIEAFNPARAAQALTAREGRNTGLAVIDECGGSIHPNPKRPAGERLALAARGLTYGEKIVFSGPLVRSVVFDGGKAVLEWDHVGAGLVAREMALDPAGESHPYSKRSSAAWRVKEGSTAGAELVGFAVCGPDEKYVPARAEIVGPRIVVSSTAVAVPTAVRYGFLTKDQPICNLFNRDGLPAAAFDSAFMTSPLSVSAGIGGSVAPAGRLITARGAVIGIRATPAPDHLFNGWTVLAGAAEVSDPKAAETTVRIKTAAVLRANFLHRIACSIGRPVDPALVRTGASITVSATAAVRQGSGGIRTVEFFVGDRHIGRAASPPYTCVWERVPEGVHLLSARATDDAGLTAASSPVCVVATASGSWAGLHAEGGDVSRYVDGGRHWTAHTFTTNCTLRVGDSARAADAVRRGGPGLTSTLRDGVTAVTYAAGGAARSRPVSQPPVADGGSKEPNTGDGGDGGSSSHYSPYVGAKGGNGGSGIVIIRYATGVGGETSGR